MSSQRGRGVSPLGPHPHSTQGGDSLEPPPQRPRNMLFRAARWAETVGLFLSPVPTPTIVAEALNSAQLQFLRLQTAGGNRACGEGWCEARL